MHPSRFLVFGTLFGFALSRARATDYDTIAAMFRFTDLHLMFVIGAAIGTAALGFRVLRLAGSRTLSGRPVELRAQPWHRGAVQHPAPAREQGQEPGRRFRESRLRSPQRRAQ